MIKPIKTAREATMVWLGSYVFFLLTLANNFSASHDSIHYLLGITQGRNLFHQHHLLYHFSAHLWLTVFKSLLTSVPEHYIIESFTALWGSATLAICYLFFRNRFTLPPLLSVTGTSLIAFSYGTWFYSVNIEVYTPPLFFILCSLYIITKRNPALRDVFSVAVFHSLAILFHQVNILFTIVVIYWLLVNWRKREFALTFAQYAVAGGLITGGTYFVAGWIIEGHDTVAGFGRWVLGYTLGNDYWQSVSMKTPLAVAAGLSRSFIGGHFIFNHPLLGEFLSDAFQSHHLRDEVFLARKIPPSQMWALTVLTIIFITAMIVMAARFMLRYRRMFVHYHVVKPLIVCLAVYSVFFCFWMPEILEFWILQMVVVWLLLAGMLPAFRFPFNINIRAGLLFLSGALFLINYFGSIRWLQDINNDWYYTKVKELDSSLDRSDVVVVENEWIMKDYVRHFSKARVIATDEPGFNRIEASRIVDEAVSGKRRVYIFNGYADTARWEAIRSY